ncbi:MAG: hypothetical protein KC561_21280, partial [Myxococcales bacterium]|nr:hypothetical protein [Myxococcales bacterium]
NGHEEGIAFLREQAGQFNAAHVLLLDLNLSREREGFSPDSGLYIGALTVLLASADDPNGEVMEDSLEFAFERPSESAFLNDVSSTWIDVLFPSVIQWLYETPSLQAKLDGESSLEELSSMSQFREKAERVELRQEMWHGFESFCAIENDNLAASLAAEDGMHCVGNPCGQLTAIGVSSDGSVAYAQDISRRPIFRINSTETRWAEPPETVYAVSTADSSMTPVFRTGNIYGFGEISTDGGFASVAGFTPRGSQGIATIDLASGEWTDTTVLAGRDRAPRMLP